MSKIIFGIHAVHSLIRKDPTSIQEVFILNGKINDRLQQFTKTLKNLNIIIHRVNKNLLDKKAEGGVHQGILARAKWAMEYQESDILHLLSTINNHFFLILDGITDPQNLGACIRSADAAGVDAIIIPKDRSVGLTATVKKVASGAAEHIPIIKVTNLARTMRLFQEANIWIIGTDSKITRSLFQSNLNKPIVIVMGSEDKGIRRLTREHCNELISIPLLGSVSSLNVSVATGICLFEAVRQRSLK